MYLILLVLSLVSFVAYSSRFFPLTGAEESSDSSESKVTLKTFSLDQLPYVGVGAGSLQLFTLHFKSHITLHSSLFTLHFKSLFTPPRGSPT